MPTGVLLALIDGGLGPSSWSGKKQRGQIVSSKSPDKIIINQEENKNPRKVIKPQPVGSWSGLFANTHALFVGASSEPNPTESCLSSSQHVDGCDCSTPHKNPGTRHAIFVSVSLSTKCRLQKLMVSSSRMHTPRAKPSTVSTSYQFQHTGRRHRPAVRCKAAVARISRDATVASFASNVFFCFIFVLSCTRSHGCFAAHVWVLVAVSLASTQTRLSASAHAKHSAINFKKKKEHVHGAKDVRSA